MSVNGCKGDDSSKETPINAKVIDAIKEIDEAFWDAFDDMTDCFPDTADGEESAHVVVMSAITSIAANYFIRFPTTARITLLETLVQHLRYIEIQMRDFKEPD